MFEEQLIKILELSVEKNGVMSLTNKHLLNIIKLAKTLIDTEQELIDKVFDSAGCPNID
uniref:Uncharacterized protein n=1 Tax=viral metagenome TaxID=1070528 RepID=A0A6H2A4H9_9ZZZZ